MKKSITVVFIILVISMSCSVSNAYDYRVRFGGTSPSIINWNNPHPSWYSITSKWEQPRDVVNTGTNPHRGMDNTAPYGTTTYAVWNGWVIHRGTYTILFQIDINNDGVKNDSSYYCYYQHLSQKSAEGYYSKGNQIAKSGDEGGAWSPHLHFGGNSGPGLDVTDTIWYRNEPNYRWTSNWNSGKDTDVYSLVTWSSNVAGFYAYFKDSSGVITPSEVRVYHRQTGTSAWTDGGVVTGDSSHNYTYSFTGKYSLGTSVQWMFRMIRSGLPSNVYKYCWSPGKFVQPNPNPNSNSYAYGYYTNTIN